MLVNGKHVKVYIRAIISVMPTYISFPASGNGIVRVISALKCFKLPMVVLPLPQINALATAGDQIDLVSISYHQIQIQFKCNFMQVSIR